MELPPGIPLPAGTETIEAVPEIDAQRPEPRQIDLQPNPRTTLEVGEGDLAELAEDIPRVEEHRRVDRIGDLDEVFGRHQHVGVATVVAWHPVDAAGSYGDAVLPIAAEAFRWRLDAAQNKLLAERHEPSLANAADLEYQVQHCALVDGRREPRGLEQVLLESDRAAQRATRHIDRKAVPGSLNGVQPREPCVAHQANRHARVGPRILLPELGIVIVDRIEVDSLPLVTVVEATGVVPRQRRTEANASPQQVLPERAVDVSPVDVEERDRHRGLGAEKHGFGVRELQVVVPPSELPAYASQLPLPEEVRLLVAYESRKSRPTANRCSQGERSGPSLPDLEGQIDVAGLLVGHSRRRGDSRL